MVGPDTLENLESDSASLSEKECRDLLRAGKLGRVGLTSGALPVIMPVEYSYESGVIAFRAGHDAKLRAAEHGDVLAFEVDAFDVESGHGWSVHVLGRATVLTAEPHLHCIELHCEIVTGHRLASPRS